MILLGNEKEKSLQPHFKDVRDVAKNNLRPIDKYYFTRCSTFYKLLKNIKFILVGFASLYPPYISNQLVIK